jgi:uncharacterized protein YodC (DUF2158 family)
MIMEIKIGDVVELRSGSVKMTVIDIHGDSIECIYWVEDKGTFDKKEFEKAWLKLNE